MCRLVYDSEADGFLHNVTKIHCIVTKDIDTGEVKKYGPNKIKQGLLALYHADLIVAHNQINYDIQLFKKFYPKWEYKRAIDTLLCSQLLWPDQYQHGIEAWGTYFGREKPEHEDWLAFSPEMLHRCAEDVEINYLLYKKMEKELDSGIWNKAITLEQATMEVHNRQLDNGVGFNKRAAIKLLNLLNDRLDEIDSKLSPILPPRCVKLNQGTEVKKPFKMDGDYTANVIKYFNGDIPNVRGSYSRITFEEMNLNSPDQIKKYLFSIGWVPDEWNFKKLGDGSYMRTSPKITESSLESVDHTEFGRLYLERLRVRHKRNMILSQKGSGFLSVIREDGTIVSEATTCGTNTARYRHKVVANIPKVSKPYGKELRSLFIPLKGYVQVGCDLAGIEARAMVEYCLPYPGGQELHDLVLHGDFHQHNADLWGVDRDTAKSGLYCLMYGGGAPKLAGTLGKPKSQGNKLRKAFWDGNPSLKALKTDVEKYYKARGYVRGWDGRRLTIRSPHKLLNSLFQNFAAIVFKQWMVNAQEYVLKNNLDVKQMIAYHDEKQDAARPIFAGTWGNILCQLAIETGKQLNIKTKIEAEAKTGMSWAQCH